MTTSAELLRLAGMTFAKWREVERFHSNGICRKCSGHGWNFKSYRGDQRPLRAKFSFCAQCCGRGARSQRQGPAEIKIHGLKGLKKKTSRHAARARASMIQEDA